MQVENTGTMNQDSENLIMVLGEPKSGKTLCGTTIVKNPEKELLYLAADTRGLVTLKTNGLSVPFVKISARNPYGDMMDAINALHAMKPLPYKAIVLDDISTYQLKMKNWIRATKKTEITSKSGLEDGRKIFGLLIEYMQNTIIRLIDLSCTSVLLCWPKDGDPEKGKSSGAMLQGQSAEWVEGQCSCVVLLRLVRMREGEKSVYKREIRTKPWGDYRLENRLGLPDPFQIDMTVTNDGQRPIVRQGLFDLLNFKSARKVASVQAIKKAV